MLKLIAHITAICCIISFSTAFVHHTCIPSVGKNIKSSSTLLRIATATPNNANIDIDKQPNNIIRTLWDFTRPHTILGSGLSVISVFAFATPVELWTKSVFWIALLKSMVPALFMNLYVTGLNQVTDVEIDKINKPYLPIASGALTKNQGIAIIMLSLLTSLTLGRTQAWPLQAVLISSGVLGSIYSLPPFRLKRFPIFAALCILAVRGSIVNAGFFLQAKAEVLKTSIPSLLAGLKLFPECVYATFFFAIFSIVISIMKDVPDIKGDAIYKIPTFSVRAGAARIFRIAWMILFSLLGTSSIVALASLKSVVVSTITSTVISKVIISISLAAMAFDVRTRAIKVDTGSSEQVFSYYMHIWNIFYACYFLLPLTKL